MITNQELRAPLHLVILMCYPFAERLRNRSPAPARGLRPPFSRHGDSADSVLQGPYGYGGPALFCVVCVEPPGSWLGRGARRARLVVCGGLGPAYGRRQDKRRSSGGATGSLGGGPTPVVTVSVSDHVVLWGGCRLGPILMW